MVCMFLVVMARTEEVLCVVYVGRLLSPTG